MHNADTDREKIKLFRFSPSVDRHHIALAFIIFIVKGGGDLRHFFHHFFSDIFGMF